MAFLAVTLAAVVCSGIPMVEVHSHENATPGHSHDAHGHAHVVPDQAGTVPVDERGPADGDSLHAHALGGPGFGSASTPGIDISPLPYGRNFIPPPTGRLPDRFVSPLFRPPIA